MSSYDLSVIVSTRNKAHLLPMLLNHLEQQTHPAGRYEVIVVNDASTDATPLLLSRYATGAPMRIRVITRDETNGSAVCRNAAAREAEGRWLLFLDDTLLAGQELVHSHIRAQESLGGECIILGSILRHPQGPRDIFVRSSYLTVDKNLTQHRAVHFWDCRARNLSLPRDTFLKAGGYDESPELLRLEDVELAYRLCSQGMQAWFREEASAYVWQSATLAHERGVHYREGYAMRALYLRTGTKEVLLPYSCEPRLRRASDAALYPLTSRLCPSLSAAALQRSRLCQSLLRAELCRGYRDACAGKEATV